jgi:hypothetical protein
MAGRPISTATWLSQGGALETLTTPSPTGEHAVAWLQRMSEIVVLAPGPNGFHVPPRPDNIRTYVSTRLCVDRARAALATLLATTGWG